MKRFYVRLIYEIVQAKVLEYLDEVCPEIEHDMIVDIVIESIQKVALLFYVEAMELLYMCTLDLNYTFEGFVDSLVLSITGEDNEFLEKVERQK
jgi:hypothetical protein